jgi:hypothetical protein
MLKGDPDKIDMATEKTENYDARVGECNEM